MSEPELMYLACSKLCVSIAEVIEALGVSTGSMERRFDVNEQAIREVVADYFMLKGEPRRYVVQGLTHRQKPIPMPIYHEDWVRFARHLSVLSDRSAATIAYANLAWHPGNPSDGPETVCRVCGSAFDRDVSSCAGAVLRAMGAEIPVRS